MAVGVNSEVDLYTRIGNLEAVIFAGQASGSSPAKISGVDVPPVQVFATTGAAVIKPQGGVAIFSAAGAVLATLAQPIAGPPSAGGQDGVALTCIDINTQANTITTAANGINGNKHIATDGAALANQITLRAYNGVWYAQTNTGFTLS
jgi:hypothetical protein